MTNLICRPWCVQLGPEWWSQKHFYPAPTGRHSSHIMGLCLINKSSPQKKQGPNSCSSCHLSQVLFCSSLKGLQWERRKDMTKGCSFALSLLSFLCTHPTRTFIFTRGLHVAFSHFYNRVIQPSQKSSRYSKQPKNPPESRDTEGGKERESFKIHKWKARALIERDFLG